MGIIQNTSTNHNKPINIRRIAVLYRDLLSNTIHSLSDDDKKLLLRIRLLQSVTSIMQTGIRIR